MPQPSSSQKTFVIIDANAVIHRSYHALPPLTSPAGEVVNAVYGFSSLLLKVLRELKPEYLAAAFDLAGPTFRHKAYKAYKAHRVKAPDELYAQIPQVKKVLSAFSIPIFEKQGYEADDVIGTIAEILRHEKNVTCMIVTGDMDTLQLVDESVRVYTLKSGIKETQILGENEVRERYGLVPRQLPDFKGLKGDASDNIPGVPGIGDKTASALLQKFDTLEKLYEDLDSYTLKAISYKLEKPLTEKLVKLLIEYKDQAFFSKELATINCAVPLDFSLENAGRAKYARENVVVVFREFGFLSLLERLAHVEDASSENVSLPLQRGGKEGFNLPKPFLRKEGIYAKPLDVAFLNGLKLTKGEFLGVHIQTEVLLGTVVPGFFLLQADEEVRTAAFADALKDKKLFASLKKVLEDEAIAKYCHGAKNLWHLLQKNGIELAGICFDVEIAYLLTRAGARDTSLPIIVLQELGEEYKAYAATNDPRPTTNDTEAVSIAQYIKRLKDVLSQKIVQYGLEEVFYKIEMPLVPILAHMEKLGIRIDMEKIKNISKSFERELAVLEKEIHKLANISFNVNSTKELRTILFQKMQIAQKGIRKTTGGVISTQASELEKLKGAHPIIEKILAYREFFKIKTTYLDALPQLVKEDGRIHTTYMQLGAATGRFSSQDPNLQNIPIRGAWGKEIRSVFTAEKGWTLLAADYSQIELRVVAHLSKDPTMRDVFQRGDDIHTRTAAMVFGVEPGKVTKDMRAQAKTLNFGVLYGMGPQAFGETAGVGLEEAKKFIAGYFREFAAVRGYLDAMKAEAELRGYVETLFGRRRYIPEIRSTNFAVKRAGERMAINMPVQGTAADIMKSAMIRIDERLKKEGYIERVKMLLQVHDELVFEVQNDILKEAATIIKEEMENVAKLEVPLVAEVKAGKNWGEMSPVEID